MTEVRPASVVLMRQQLFEQITYTSLTIQVQELDGKRYMIVRMGAGLEATPILIPNRTNVIEVRVEGRRLVIDDGYHRKPRVPAPAQEVAT